MKFTLFLNHLSQILLTGGQVFNAISPLISDKYKVPVAAVLGGSSYAVSILAHSVNTDGTPQTVAFVPPPTKGL